MKHMDARMLCPKVICNHNPTLSICSITRMGPPIPELEYVLHNGQSALQTLARNSLFGTRW